MFSQNDFSFCGGTFFHYHIIVGLVLFVKGVLRLHLQPVPRITPIPHTER